MKEQLIPALGTLILAVAYALKSWSDRKKAEADRVKADADRAKVEADAAAEAERLRQRSVGSEYARNMERILDERLKALEAKQDEVHAAVVPPAPAPEEPPR